MKNFTTSDLTKVAMVAAIYVALTVALGEFSYGPLQFRISEALVLLAFFNPIYIPGLVLGCFLANLSSPLGLIDIVCGTLATYIAVKGIYFTRQKLGSSFKSMMIATLWPIVANGIIVGLMLSYAFQIPASIIILEVALSEFVIVSIIGVALFKVLGENKQVVNMLSLEM